MEVHEWKKLMPQVQYMLNNDSRQRLNGRTADEVFLAKAGDNPLDLVIPNTESYSITPVTFTSEAYKKALNASFEALESMHQDIVDIQSKIRSELKKAAEERLGVSEVQYAIGDWVLVSRATRKEHKLQLEWSGPFQVVDILNPWVYKVRSVVTD